MFLINKKFHLVDIIFRLPSQSHGIICTLWKVQCNSTAFPPTHGEKGCCFCKLVWITTTFCFVIRSSSLYKASSKCWLSFYTFVMLIIDSLSYAKDQWSATTHAVENHAVPSKVYLLSQITYLFCPFQSLPNNSIDQIYRFCTFLG